VRALRLQALADAPDDFDATLDETRGWTEVAWHAWLARGATFLCEEGLAAGVPHDGDPAVVFLEALWVHPGRRGTGAADALLRAVAAWAAERGAREVRLHVDRRNARARRFYERSGFRACGEVARARDGAAEIEMRRPLAAEARA